MLCASQNKKTSTPWARPAATRTQARRVPATLKSLGLRRGFVIQPAEEHSVFQDPLQVFMDELFEQQNHWMNQVWQLTESDKKFRLCSISG